jgi:hypothetical protein
LCDRTQFSCITITNEREKIVDFSHHYLDSGLRIMVLNKTKFSIVESVKSIYSPIVIKAFAYIGLFIIICGHVFWWVERGHKYISTNIFQGYFKPIGMSGDHDDCRLWRHCASQLGWPIDGLSRNDYRNRGFWMDNCTTVFGNHFAEHSIPISPPWDLRDIDWLQRLKEQQV